MSTYLKISGLSLSFGDQKIFDKADLEISKPGFYCLMGRNGCGKTTLFKTILNDVKYQEGSIEFIGDSSQVSYCMADPVIFENLSVYENLKLITDDDKKINKLADIFNIGSILKESGRKCSAGEKQRICLIRAIIEDKPIILLDEATSHLDDFNSTKALDYLKELSKNHVIIYSTHYEYDAKKYADAFIRIEDFKIVLEQVNKLEDSEVKIKEKSNYYPKKLFRKIIFWKPECLFSILFICMLCLTMIFTWLLNITPEKVYKEYQSNASYPQYSAIDDFDACGLGDDLYLLNDNNKFVDNFINRNSKFKIGLKNVSIKLAEEKYLYIDYVMFDESIEDDSVLISNRIYERLKFCNLIIDEDKFSLFDSVYNYKNFRNSFFNYLVTNQLTFKKMLKLSGECTTSNTTVDLISGRLPQNEDEIAIIKPSYGEIPTTITLKRYKVSKTFNVVGVYSSAQCSIYNIGYLSTLLTPEGYNFILEENALDFSKYKIAYGNSYDLSLDDYKYMVDNSMFITNEITKYAYNSGQYILQLRTAFMYSYMYILSFDILLILFYLIYWKNSNVEKYDLLKVLKKTSNIKKDFIVSKILINVLILGASIGAFFITQKLVNQNLIDGSIVYFSLDKFETPVLINYFFNSFFVYVIPICVIVQSLICISQLRRGLK